MKPETKILEQLQRAHTKYYPDDFWQKWPDTKNKGPFDVLMNIDLNCYAIEMKKMGDNETRWYLSDVSDHQQKSLTELESSIEAEIWVWHPEDYIFTMSIDHFNTLKKIGIKSLGPEDFHKYNQIWKKKKLWNLEDLI